MNEPVALEGVPDQIIQGMLDDQKKFQTEYQASIVTNRNRIQAMQDEMAQSMRLRRSAPMSPEIAQLITLISQRPEILPAVTKHAQNLIAKLDALVKAELEKE
jgi:ArsR family metal-binding transcriptional regulator